MKHRGLLFEIALFCAGALALALLGNAVHPDGLKWGRDYFPDTRAVPGVEGAAGGAIGGTTGRGKQPAGIPSLTSSCGPSAKLSRNCSKADSPSQYRMAQQRCPKMVSAWKGVMTGERSSIVNR